jgi:hypothetical protein
VLLYHVPLYVLDDQDGREYGLGVVVGRNIDRGDAKNIPHHQLELCEVRTFC